MIMIFYLKPPPVIIDLRKFNECCFSRLQFLTSGLNEENGNVNFPESVTPGTKLDSVGHFILRCFCVHNPNVCHFILRKECELFRYRLEQYSENAYLIRDACKSVIKDIRSLRNYKEIDLLTGCRTTSHSGSMLLSTLKCVCELLLRDYVNHHFRLECKEGCHEFEVEIPFQVCLSSVSSRIVQLYNGNAIVPCSQWKELLVELFSCHFTFGLTMIERSIQFNTVLDIRWTSAFNTLSTMYQSYTTRKQLPNQKLNSKMVDYEKEYFPPCMSHLLTILRSHHRLSYAWRYRFSLFLKDIGLSVDSSIEFWKNEYSKSCSKEASCKHSWKENQRKYRYSIRHIYGMEGCKKIGSSKTCHHIENMQLGMRDEGGCPFVHFDEAHMLETLSDHVVDDEGVVNNILALKAAKKPYEACRLHMATAIAARNPQLKFSDVAIEYESPIQYYFNFKSYVCGSFDW